MTCARTVESAYGQLRALRRDTRQIELTLPTRSSYSHPLAAPKDPIPLDNGIVHLGLEDLEETVLTDRLASLWPFDQRARCEAQLAQRGWHDLSGHETPCALCGG